MIFVIFVTFFMNFMTFREYFEYPLWSISDMPDSFVIQGVSKAVSKLSETAVLSDFDVSQLLFGWCTSVLLKPCFVHFLQWKFESLRPRGP